MARGQWFWPLSYNVLFVGKEQIAWSSLGSQSSASAFRAGTLTEPTVWEKKNLMACGSEISVSKSQGPGEASGPGGALAESQTFFLAPLIQPVSLTTQGLSSSPAQRGPEDPLTLSLSCLSIGKAWQFIQGLEVLSRAKRHQGGG